MLTLLAGDAGADGGHTPERFEATSPAGDYLAGALVCACQQGTDHDCRGSSREGFGYVAGGLNAAISDEWDGVGMADGGAFYNSGELRNARTCDYAGSTGGAGADANFDCVYACFYEVLRAFRCGNIAGDYVHIGPTIF